MVAKLKAEFTQAYYDVHGTPWRARLIASLDRIHRIASYVPWLHNFFPYESDRFVDREKDCRFRSTTEIASTSVA